MPNPTPHQHEPGCPLLQFWDASPEEAQCQCLSKPGDPTPNQPEESAHCEGCKGFQEILSAHPYLKSTYRRRIFCHGIDLAAVIASGKLDRVLEDRLAHCIEQAKREERARLEPLREAWESMHNKIANNEAGEWVHVTPQVYSEICALFAEEPQEETR